MKQVRVIVRGRVQGVGFRAATAHEARRLGVVGWVRNQLDGDVEVEASGDDAPVDAFVAWLRRGPSLARVTGIDVVDLPVAAQPPGFTVR